MKNMKVLKLFNSICLIKILCLIICLYFYSSVFAEAQKTKIGAIRWDGYAGSSNWIGAEAERTLSPLRYHYRVPFFGIEVDSNHVTIDGTKQSVMDQEIVYANYAGIDYWAFDYYSDYYGLNYAFNLYKNSSLKHLVDYCYIMFPANFTVDISIDQLVQEFKDPSYVKVMDNRPLLYFFFGYDNTVRIKDIDTLRARSIRSGAGNPYIVLMNFTYEFNLIDSLHMDALSRYTTGGMGGVTYQTLASWDIAWWNIVGINNNKKMIPHITSGWDKRTNYDAQTTYDYDSSYKNQWVKMPKPDELAGHIQDGINWVNQNPKIAESNTVIIYAWNEHTEGGWLCPTLYNYGGTERIAALRKQLNLGKFINITRQSKDTTFCAGSVNQEIFCQAKEIEGCVLQYQWFKDDSLLIGENSSTLKFINCESSIIGGYNCKVTAIGFPDQEWSEQIYVNVFASSKITENPKDMIRISGTKATFYCDATIQGKKLSDAIYEKIANIQWYKYVTADKSIALNDNMPRISGSKSNYLIINDVTNEDFGKYYAVIHDNCGIIKSEYAELIEEDLEIKITAQPTEVLACSGNEVKLLVSAETKNVREINYQWYKENVPLTDNNEVIEGSKSRMLVITKLNNSDAGEYYLEMSLEGTKYSIESKKISLKVKSKSEILTEPRDTIINEGENLSLKVILKNPDEADLKYQWYHNDEIINGAVEPLFIKVNVDSSDSGEYFCEIKNFCGLTYSDKAIIVVEKSQTAVTEIQSKGYSLSMPLPSPVNNVSNVRYFIPNTSNVKISLSDLQTSFQIELVNKLMTEGEHFVIINTDELNISNGTYFLKLESNGIVNIQKFVVLK